MILTVKNRSALLDENFHLVEADTSKDFFTYFDYLCENILDFVQPDERARFADLVSGKCDGADNRSGVFHLLRNTGEYRYNFVTVRNVRKPYLARIRLFDIYDAIDFIRTAVDENNKIHTALGLTNDYLFSYQKSEDLLTLAYYSQGKEIVLHKMRLGDWKNMLVERKLVSEKSVDSLNVFCNEIALNPNSIMSKLEGSIRTSGAVQENLRLIGARYEGLDGTYMIGRILSDEEMAKLHGSHALIEELQLDVLSQVYNKKTITAYAEQKIRAALQEPFALVIVDLDHFKPVNDRFGHLAGDKVIARAAQKIKEVVGDDGVVGRFGGDEFMIVLESVVNVSILRGALRAIMVQVKKEFEGNFDDIVLSCSVGASVYPTNGTTYDELFKKADFCLYRAKEKGRDRYVFYRDDLHAQAYAERLKENGEGKASEGREVQELKHLAEYFKTLHKNPREAVMKLLKHMIGLYSVDCIHIYAGEKMESILHVGEDRPEMRTAEYALSDDFRNSLDADGVALFNFVSEIPGDNVFGAALRNRDVSSSIHCVIGSKNDFSGVLAFNKTRVPARFADYEENCVRIFASSLALVDLDDLRDLEDAGGYSSD